MAKKSDVRSRNASLNRVRNVVSIGLNLLICKFQVQFFERANIILGKQICGFSLRAHSTLYYQHHAVSQFDNLFHIMRCENYGSSCSCE
jgi:hypothetical protein